MEQNPFHQNRTLRSFWIDYIRFHYLEYRDRLSQAPDLCALDG